MTYLILGSALILMFIFACAQRRVSLYSPLMMTAVVWQIVFISGMVYGGRFYPVTDRAFVLWLTWFLGSGLVYYALAIQPQPANETELRRLPLDYSLVLAGLILWLAYQVRVVGKAGPAEFFSNLRLSSNEAAGLESLGAVGRFYPVVFALFLFETVNARPDNRRLRLLLWCLMLLFAFATMGKLAILTPVLAWAVIRGIQGTFPLRKLLVLAPVVFAVMLVLHFVRAVRGDQFVLAEFLSIYTYSPLVALGYMETPVDAPFGAHTFRLVYAVIHEVLGGTAPVQVVQHYVAVPFMTNVYTVMHPFVVDFGAVGVLFGAIFYGLFFGLLFHQARARRQLALIIYAGLSVVLVGQFIGEFLVTMLSGQLQFVFAACLFTYWSRSVERVG